MRALADVIELGGGRRAAHEVVGEGEPLLYFQGGPGMAADLLRDDAELLADRFAVHLIDPHGSGGSTPPADPSLYDHLGHARFYDEVRRALGIERATIMGISFGGIVALTYAALFPEVADRCVAISTRVIGDDLDDEDGAAEMERLLARHAGAPWYPAARRSWDEWTERVLATEDPAEADAIMREILPLYTAYPDEPRVRAAIERWRRDARGDLAAAKAWEGGLWQTIDARPLLGRVRCPVLVLVGELDPICGPAQARRLAEGLPDAEVVAIPECGHFVPIEAPERFRSLVAAFGARGPTRPGAGTASP
ncbi:MAG: proline iminopeptidase [Solirubrobacteraceae bacterium]|jgi:proline iminopeptidase|nr:proline iminopeptidase [Solirubrobacteraceae bacterium]